MSALESKPITVRLEKAGTALILTRFQPGGFRSRWFSQPFQRFFPARDRKPL